MSKNRKVLQGNQTKIDIHQNVVPYGLTNAITQEVTPLKNGVVAPSVKDVVDAKHFVDKNHK